MYSKINIKPSKVSGKPCYDERRLSFSKNEKTQQDLINEGKKSSFQF